MHINKIKPDTNTEREIKTNTIGSLRRSHFSQTGRSKCFKKTGTNENRISAVERKEKVRERA